MGPLLGLSSDESVSDRTEKTFPMDESLSSDADSLSPKSVEEKTKKGKKKEKKSKAEGKTKDKKEKKGKKSKSEKAEKDVKDKKKKEIEIDGHCRRCLREEGKE